jgi:hypothetical protein
MVSDLTPDWRDNQSMSSINALRDAVEDKDWKNGHIVHDGNNFSINGEVEFKGEEIPSDLDLKPVRNNAENQS